MKRLVTVLLFCFAIAPAAVASHITGGEMYYSYQGMSGGNHQYLVTLKLFQRCGSGRAFPNPTTISVFENTAGARVMDVTVFISNTQTLRISNPDPCITNPPDVCYEVAYYTFNVSLPPNPNGYSLASQVNYRINGISNLAPGYGNIGATYMAEIPGTLRKPSGPENNSAYFTGSDLVIVCGNNEFSYSFAAEDPDTDELRYSFCNAYNSTSLGGTSTSPLYPPPYPVVPYGGGFSGAIPLGNDVHINPTTGLITGVAPGSGIYVVTVCVEEIRDGVVIARQRKDLQIHIADCDVASASLLPEYQLCGSTQTITLTNQSTSPLIQTTNWEFTDASNTVIFTATGPSVTYTFPTIGLYTVKLVINRNQACTDSTTSVIRVFPGFNPDFTSTGICITKPTDFRDATTSVHGTPNSWTWDFGETTTSADISTDQHPAYTYPFTGIKKVQLIATDTRGCRDTVVKDVEIIERPPIKLAFRDTLICVGDVLPLQASGDGTFRWYPVINMVNPNSPSPTVSPITTTRYYVELNSDGCLNTDSVDVRVVDHVTLSVMGDTIICRTDTIQLRVQSDGLHYSWQQAAAFIDPLVKNPFVVTNIPFAEYEVTAVIGGCSAKDTIRVTTIPYPVVNAGAPFTICYNTDAVLKGSTDGSAWFWTPAHLLDNPLSLTPKSHPPRTTDFILTATDTKGCPKPSRDTVTVTVLPKMRVSAGRDTAVVVNQPLQLGASGGEDFTWSPATNLSTTRFYNPVAIFRSPSNGVQYKVVVRDTYGCADSAFITIKVYQTLPTIFVPTAFTPNSDGRNDLLRPLAVGMKSIDYFHIYNRWGELLYVTTVNGQGWDGTIKGIPQTTGTYVWMVKATDYTGAPYFQKGTVTLIR